MTEIKLNLDSQNRGAFYLVDDNGQMGEMAISIQDKELTVYHTEVDPKAEGKGYAKQLLNHMVDYARTHHLKVIPLCPFVHAQFKRHPQEFADVWKGEEA